jgi:hypothetical protein
VRMCWEKLRWLFVRGPIYLDTQTRSAHCRFFKDIVKAKWNTKTTNQTNYIHTFTIHFFAACVPMFTYIDLPCIIYVFIWEDPMEFVTGASAILSARHSWRLRAKSWWEFVPVWGRLADQTSKSEGEVHSC